MGGVHAHAIRASGAVLVGIADNDLSLATTLQQRAQAERATASPAELIEAPDIDAVHVCTPNATHFSLVEAALRAGKHVVCEKPLATSAAEAARLDWPPRPTTTGGSTPLKAAVPVRSAISACTGSTWWRSPPASAWCW